MRLVKTIAAPELSPQGLSFPQSDEESALRAALQAFSDRSVTETAREIDRLAADEVTEPSSKWWQLINSFADLGLDIDALYFNSNQATGNRLKATAYEELGRGDAGFAIGLMVANFPYVMCRLLGRDDLANMAHGKVGCWIATQAERGSDVGDIEGTEIHPGSHHETGQMYAEIGDAHVWLYGRSSRWVSLGPLAQIALAYFPLRQNGKALFNDDGTTKGVGVFVPLDAPGVDVGRPLDKLGQRSLPQGSLGFNAVTLPLSFIVAEPDEYRTNLLSALCEGNQTMGAVFAGVARRAYEYALAYAHTRRQGGTTLIQHQLVRYRLFEAFRRLQTIRATVRQTFDFNARASEPHLLASVVSKVTATEGAIGIVEDCMRMFGGSGLTKEMPLEKLLRDARAAVTEDGDNHLLSLKSGSYLSWAYLSSK
ncbi:MAG: acyl-CoA dehydrogenase family protein [Pseudomonadota bacterium]